MNSRDAREINPIFVVGAPRSGTTLVGKILDQHPDVYSPGETHFFEDIWSRKEELGELMGRAEVDNAVSRIMTLFKRYNFHETQQMVEECLDHRKLATMTLEWGGGYDNLYRAFASALVSCVGKERICDDTPKHLFYLPDIVRLFPEAKFIGCIRDPRDFLNSYRNYWRRTNESERLKALYHPIVTSLIWRSSAKLLLDYEKQLGGSQLILVRYEKLVQEPEAEIRRISDSLDLEFQPSMLTVETNNSSFEQNLAGIFATSVGRWRGNLPPEDAWWSQTINQPYLNELDLQKEAISVSRIRLLGILLSTPFALHRAIRVNSAKRGPLPGYIARRMQALLR